MKIIRLFLLFLLLTFQSCSGQNQNKNKTVRYVFVANWNLENLFDTKDDPKTNDEEFLPDGSKHWTEKRLDKKISHLAMVLQYMNENKGPDLLGVEEVEHKNLLERIIKNTSGKKYKIAYAESPDHRGIDVGLIYNSDIFKLSDVEPIKVVLPNHRETRYILHVTLNFNNQPIHVFVNHWPSRREGLKKSEPNRIAAATTLLKEIEKLYKNDSQVKIFVIGDFNDLPANISISKVLRSGIAKCNSKVQNGLLMVNLAYPLFKKGKGSYKYRDHWNMLDQILVSKSIFERNNFNYVCGSFEIIKPPFMISHSRRWEGTPFPTYGGRTYLGGFSDHFPVGALFEIQK